MAKPEKKQFDFEIESIHQMERSIIRITLHIDITERWDIVLRPNGLYELFICSTIRSETGTRKSILISCLQNVAQNMDQPEFWESSYHPILFIYWVSLDTPADLLSQVDGIKSRLLAGRWPRPNSSISPDRFSLAHAFILPLRELSSSLVRGISGVISHSSHRTNSHIRSLREKSVYNWDGISALIFWKL